NTSNLTGALLGVRVVAGRRVVHVRESYEGHARLFGLYARLAGRSATHVVAISRDIAAECRAAGFERVTVVHNGLEFAPLEAGEDHGVAVIVGRLNDWKGHDVLFDALKVLRDRGVVVPLAVVGDAFPGREDQAVAIRER